MSTFWLIRNCIEEILKSGEERLFAIYPFGECGIQVKKVLNECFGIQEYCILDGNLSKLNPNIKSIEYLGEIDTSKIIVLFTAEDPKIKELLIGNLLVYCEEEQIVKIFPDREVVTVSPPQNLTEKGKYSNGPLCNHWLVERVGAFCSFAAGTNVLQNHSTEYISTSGFIYYDTSCNELFPAYESCKERPWYVEGIVPKGKVKNLRRITIGNDVWLGYNVLITNGANIGNGVIAAAGAVITKDVPDYAVVAGVPARIIKYRYTPEQIEKLNDIQWWNWSDDKIRECYDDFFLNIDEFIEKHSKEI